MFNLFKLQTALSGPLCHPKPDGGNNMEAFIFYLYGNTDYVPTHTRTSGYGSLLNLQNGFQIWIMAVAIVGNFLDGVELLCSTMERTYKAMIYTVGKIGNFIATY